MIRWKTLPCSLAEAKGESPQAGGGLAGREIAGVGTGPAASAADGFTIASRSGGTS
jgi:hypothetical protein